MIWDIFWFFVKMGLIFFTILYFYRLGYIHGMQDTKTAVQEILEGIDDTERHDDEQ